MLVSKIVHKINYMAMMLN